MCSEGGGIVEGVWAAAMGDRQDIVKIGMIPRKIIRYRPTGLVGSDALHALFHELSNQYKGFGGTCNNGRNRISRPFREIMPKW